jgi:hypothetical protein
MTRHPAKLALCNHPESLSKRSSTPRARGRGADLQQPHRHARPQQRLADGSAAWASPVWARGGAAVQQLLQEASGQGAQGLLDLHAGFSQEPVIIVAI